MTEKIVSRMLTELCIPCNFDGFGYLKEAIVLISECNMPMYKVYLEVGKRNGKSEKVIERSIRHAAEHACDFATDKTLAKIFGGVYRSEAKLKNAEFIYGIVEYLKYNE